MANQQIRPPDPIPICFFVAPRPREEVRLPEQLYERKTKAATRRPVKPEGKELNWLFLIPSLFFTLVFGLMILSSFAIKHDPAVFPVPVPELIPPHPKNGDWIIGKSTTGYEHAWFYFQGQWIDP